MLEALHPLMERLGRKVSKPVLLRLGWLASVIGLAFLVSLWLQASDDLFDWLAGAMVACGRPFVGFMTARIESLEQARPDGNSGPQ